MKRGNFLKSLLAVPAAIKIGEVVEPEPKLIIQHTPKGSTLDGLFLAIYGEKLEGLVPLQDKLAWGQMPFSDPEVQRRVYYENRNRTT